MLRGVLSGGDGDWLYHATSLSTLPAIMRAGGLDPEMGEAEGDDGTILKAIWVSDEPDMLVDYGNLWLRFPAIETQTTARGELTVARFIPLKWLQVCVGDEPYSEDWANLQLVLKQYGLRWLKARIRVQQRRG